jgi:branched-chain amino acid transport system permease protein
MRFIFKTSYAQDINLAKHGGHVFWYGLLALLLLGAPWLFAEYWLAQMTFILIYAIVGLGLMLLAGFTGQFSLGHAAFLGVGAYTQAVLTNAGVPFPLALLCAAGLSATVGVVVGLPALRVKGIYLGMATLSFGFIVEEVLARWEKVTGGNAGIHIKAPDLFGWKVDSGEGFYYLCLFITVAATLGILNLLRSSTGRAFVAIRDSEISLPRAWASTWRATRRCRSRCRRRWPAWAARCMRTNYSSSRPTSSTSSSRSTCC